MGRVGVGGAIVRVAVVSEGEPEMDSIPSLWLVSEVIEVVINVAPVNVGVSVLDPEEKRPLWSWVPAPHFSINDRMAGDVLLRT